MTDKPAFENSENLKVQDKPDDWIYLGSKKKLEQIEEEGIQKKEKPLLLTDQTESEAKKQRNFSFYSMNLHYTQNMTVAYLLKKFPGTFAVACRVMTEIRYRVPEFQP